MAFASALGRVPVGRQGRWPRIPFEGNSKGILEFPSKELEGCWNHSATYIMDHEDCPLLVSDTVNVESTRRFVGLTVFQVLVTAKAYEFGWVGQIPMPEPWYWRTFADKATWFL